LVGAVEREVPEVGELHIDPVQQAGVVAHVDYPGVKGPGVVIEGGVGLGGEVRAEILRDDGPAACAPGAASRRSAGRRGTRCGVYAGFMCP
jgi:hypothetical protein